MEHIERRTFGTRELDDTISNDINDSSFIFEFDKRYTPTDGKCAYCGNYYPIDELKIVGDGRTKFSVDGNIFGGYISQRYRQYIVYRCHRCNKIHTIATWVHFILGIICIWLAILLIQPSSFTWDNYITPVLTGSFFAYVISVIDWFVIKIIFKVRRKPMINNNFL